MDIKKIYIFYKWKEGDFKKSKPSHIMMIFLSFILY